MYGVKNVEIYKNEENLYIGRDMQILPKNIINYHENITFLQNPAKKKSPSEEGL